MSGRVVVMACMPFAVRASAIFATRPQRDAHWAVGCRRVEGLKYEHAINSHAIEGLLESGMTNEKMEHTRYVFLFFLRDGVIFD